MADTRRRVKVYTLNDERQWDDRGTGHVSSAFVDRLKGMTLIVRAEQDGSLLLESKILLDTAYQKQQETLIVWSEGESTDLALSFQEKTGCDEIWEKICEVQGKDPSVDVTQDITDDDDDLPGDRLDDSIDPLQQQSPYVLPACELGQLEEIAEIFTSSLSSLVRRDQLARGVEESEYIQKLLTLFHTCEDLENIEGLHRLYEIMRCIFLLNRSSLFDVMLQDCHIMDVVGCLEYDPALPAPQKHRDYLLQEVNFKEVLPMENAELKRKIHQTFRLQYIQDVVLPTPSVFEENMLSTLSSLIFFNKVEIVNIVRGDDAFLSSVFEQLRDDATEDKKKHELAGFVRELCSLSQTLQPTSRDDFFRQLGELGVLQSVEVLLTGDDSQSHRLAIDVFAHVVEHSPSMVRDFARKETSEAHGDGDEDLFLLNLVIEQIIYDPDPELSRAIQLIGLLRVLLDPESMLANKNEKTEFLAFYYRNCMHVLMAPLLANTSDEKGPGKDDYQTAHLLSLILDLLTFSVEHHTYNIKNYILNKDLLRRVLVLLNSKHAFLPLSALRFMRKIVGRPDEFYRRYLVKGDLFTPVVEKLFRCGKRYNLLNSAILEIFEYIRSEDIKCLVEHVVERHYKRLQDIGYTTIFHGLKKCYDEEATRGATKTSPGNHRYRRDDRDLDEEEESWFEKEDELDAADAFEAPKVNIDSVLGLVDTADRLPSNGVHEAPTEEADDPNVTVKNGLVGLVDYSDDDSDDDATEKEPALEDDVTKESVIIERCDVGNDASESASKKPRLLQVTDD